MKKILRIIPVIIAAIAIFAASTLSWLIVDNIVPFPTNFGGSTKTAYFAGGDGSNEDPYIIKSPVHFYNLAWLQYLGYFNLGSYINNGRAQSFFKLDFDGDNLNLSGLALPPIGTREYPFIGYFNGNGKTISNFTVSNSKTDLIRRPLAAIFSGDVLYTTGTRTSVVADSVDILGLFGVTGNFNSFLDYYVGKSVPVDGTATEVVKHGTDVQFPGQATIIKANEFYSLGMNVRNFYVDKIRINSVSSKVLVGLAAGYVGSTVENVGVYRSKVNVKGDSLSGVSNVKRASGATVDYDGVISNYSIVGDYDSEIVGWTESPSGGGTSPGEDSDWGGSIDMEALHGRLLSFRNNASYVTDSYADTTTTTNRKRFYDADKGSAYFYTGNGGGNQFLYLYGGKNGIAYVTDNVPDGGFFIKSGSTYLTLNGLGTNGARMGTTDSTKAVTWYYDEQLKALYTFVDGSIRYLNLNQTILNLSSIQTMEWTKDGSSFYYTYVSPKGNAYTYYLAYSSIWCGLSSQQSLTLDTSGKRLASVNYTYSDSINGVNRSLASFFPILTNDDYTVSNKNPGYIASGSTSTSSNTVTGDIRVNYTSFSTYGGISKSVNLNTGFGDGSTLELLTRTKNSDGFVRIKDTHNENNNSVHSDLFGFSKISYSDLGLRAYYIYDKEKNEATGARENLNTLLYNKSSVYGMHFMNAPIGKNNVYTAPSAMINGILHENYEMPANAISFAAPSKGYVSFFAGTYYGTDKNFFSLHRVFRNADKTISAIKEISKIYSTGGQRYVYEYTDGTFSDTLSGNYGLEFDCEWITNPTIVKNALYYFEIPVNANDEYALGSATTGDGAYLMYLDIGANGSGSGGGGGETQTLPYIMKSVDFVAMPTNDGSDTLTVPTDNGSVKFPNYRDVGFKLGTTADVIYFRREDYDSLPADDGEIETIVYYYRETNAILVTVFPTGYGSEDDGTNAKWE